MTHGSWSFLTLLLAQADEAETAAPMLRIGWLLLGLAVLAAVRLTRGSLSGGARGGLAVIAAALLVYALPTPLQPRADAAIDAVWSPLAPLVSEPLAWALGLGAAALILALPPGGRTQRMQGAALGVASLGFWAAGDTAGLQGMGQQAIFWGLTLVTLGAAGATICMRNAVYSAIWFALSLLGTAGLFFYQGSQFLGVATIVVYAGAIVVTFLFVVMLAQPEGHATYDRITWGRGTGVVSVLASSTLVAALAFALSTAGDLDRQDVSLTLSSLRGDDGRPLLEDNQLAGADYGDAGWTITLRSNVTDEQLGAVAAVASQQLEGGVAEVRRLERRDDVLDAAHMAHLGSELFTRHLLSVEVAGTLLLAALVGAIAMAIQAKDLAEPEDALGE